MGVITWLLGILKGFESRDIFRYWDGRRYRFGDPWAIFRATMADPEFDWETTPSLIQMEAADNDSLRTKFDAMLVASTMVRKVFSVPPFEQGGLTDNECLALLWSFSAYVGAIKKNTSPTPISPTSTASSREGDTKPVSDCGSIGIESGPQEPTGRTEALSGA